MFGDKNVISNIQSKRTTGAVEPSPFWSSILIFAFSWATSIELRAIVNNESVITRGQHKMAGLLFTGAGNRDVLNASVVTCGLFKYCGQ